MDCRRGGFQAHGGVRNCDATVLLHHQRANVIEMVDGSQPNEKIMYLKTVLPPKTWPRRGRKRRRKRHEPPTGQLCRRAPGAAAQTAGRVPVHDTGPPPRPATAPGGCRRRSGPGSGRRWTTPRQGRSRFRGRFPVSLVQAAGPAGATAAVAEGRLATRSDPCGGGLGAALVAYARKELKPWQRLGGLCFSALVGYLMATETVNQTPIKDTGAGAFIGAIVIVPLALKLMEWVDKLEIATLFKRGNGG